MRPPVRRIPILAARRRQAFSCIYGTPGLTMSAIVHAACIPRGTIVQALIDLERLGLIYNTFDGNHRRYYPAPWTTA